MAKVIAANEACKIGSDYREKRKEEFFLRVMETVASAARYSTSVTIAERVNGSSVYGSDLVEFLSAHPDQVDRLQNMGYAVEQTVEDVPTSWTEDEAYEVKRLFGWLKPEIKHRQVRRESTVEVRSFEISWECEEDCDGRDEETI